MQTATQQHSNTVITCPSCDSQRVALETTCQSLDVYACKECTLTFTWPLLKGQEDDTAHENSSITEQDFYAGIIKKYDPQVEKAREKAPVMLVEWQKILNRRPDNILEVGCGTGQYSDAWKALDIDWTGVEVNKSMLEFCKKRGKNVISIDEFTQSDRKFDIIFMSQVLEHVLDPKTFLINLHSRLNNGGILHIDVPNHNSLTSTIRKINPKNKDYGFIQPKHHLVAYNKKAMDTLLKNCNFHIIKSFACANNHDTYGQLIEKPNITQRMFFFLSERLGRGSLLVCIAKKQ